MSAMAPASSLGVMATLRRGLAVSLQLIVGWRVTLLLAEVEGLSCPEIAAALEIPVGTVWTRLHKARSELRQLLDGSHEP